MDISAALSSATAALQLLGVGVKARDDAKVQAAITDINLRLLDLSTAALALSEKNRSLESQLAAAQRDYGQLQRQMDERTMYLLHEIRPGAFVYAAKPTGDSTQPAHYLCQLCYDKGIKSVLRRIDSEHFGMSMQCATDPRHEITQF